MGSVMRHLLTLLAFVVAVCLGCDPNDHDPSRRQLENLRAFSQIYGHVKYFHPSDEAATIDWDKLAVHGVREVIDARDAEDLARRLRAIFVPIAPTVQIVHGKLPRKSHPDLVPESTEGLVPVAWQHYGAGLDEDPDVSLYQSARTNRPCPPYAGYVGCPWTFPTPAPGEVAVLDLGDDVHARVPLALWSDADHTLPVGDDSELRETIDPIETTQWNRRGVGLAAVVVSWNLLQHFYPYFDVIEADWPAELDSAIARGLDARTLDAWMENLQLLVAALQDGHGRVYHEDRSRAGALPIHLEWAEGSMVVTDTADPAVAVGDVITAIDGMSFDSWLDSELERAPGAPHYKRYVLLGKLIFDPPGSEVQLTLSHADGSESNVALTRVDPDPLSRRRSGPVIKTFEDGIYYVDLTRALSVDIEPQLENLAAAPGVVFDLRGYPSDDVSVVLEHLLDVPDDRDWMFVPQVTRPHGRDVTWDNLTWGLAPAEPRIRGAVAFLTNASAISYSESVMGYVHGHQLGDIIGSETAGANGNAHLPSLPGGFTMMWTGMKVLRQDGERLHGLGFPPNVRAVPTIQGIRAGRDDVLEAGLTHIRQQLRH